MKPTDINQRLIYLGYVAQRTSRLMHLGGTPKIRFKNTRRGWAYPNKGYFTIPVWAAQAHQAFAIAYVIHELSHFARSNYSGWLMRSHGKDQRRIESEAAERFGLRLIYADRSCYPRQVRCLETGRIFTGPHGVLFQDLSEYEHPACLI